MQKNLQLSESFCKKRFSLGDTSKPKCPNIQGLNDLFFFTFLEEGSPRGRGLGKAEAGFYIHVTPGQHLPKSALDYSLWSGMVSGWGNPGCMSECPGRQLVSQLTSSCGSQSLSLNSGTTHPALFALSYSVFNLLSAAFLYFSLCPYTFHESCLWEEELGRPKNQENLSSLDHEVILNKN